MDTSFFLSRETFLPSARPDLPRVARADLHPHGERRPRRHAVLQAAPGPRGRDRQLRSRSSDDNRAQPIHRLCRAPYAAAGASTLPFGQSHAQFPPDPRQHPDPVRPLPLLGVRLLGRPGSAHADPAADQGPEPGDRLSGRHPDRGRHAGRRADLAAMRSTLGGLGLGEVALQEFGSPENVLIRIERQAGRRSGAARRGQQGQGGARRALRRRHQLPAGRVRRPEGERGSALGQRPGDGLRPARDPRSTSGSGSNGSSRSAPWWP